MIENRAPVLRARIRTLAVRRRGVVHLVEKLEELAVTHFLRLEDNLQGFGVACITAADGAVGRVGEVAADVAYAGVDEALGGKVFAVEVFYAPEAACCDGGFLGAFGEGDGGGGRD